MPSLHLEPFICRLSASSVKYIPRPAHAPSLLPHRSYSSTPAYLLARELERQGLHMLDIAAEANAPKPFTSLKSPKQEKKPPLTHFLALPLCTEQSRPQLVESLGRFRDAVVEPDEGQNAGGARELGSGRGHRSSPPSALDEMRRIADEVGGYETILPSHENEEEAEVQDADLEEADKPEKTAEDKVKGREQKTTIPEAALRKPGSLHFTLGVMSLKGEGQLEAVVKLLQKLELGVMLMEAQEEAASAGIRERQADVGVDKSLNRFGAPTEGEKEIPMTASSVGGSDPGMVPPATGDSNDPATDTTSPAASPIRKHPLTISLSSLSALPKAKDATSLYLSPTPSSLIRSFAAKVRQPFLDAGFLLPDERELLLHSTIVNTIYAQKRKRTRGGKKGQKSRADRIKREVRLKIDARELLRQWRDVVWTRNLVVGRVVVCEMGAKKVFESGASEGPGAQEREPKVIDEVYKEVAGVEVPWG